MNLRASPLPYHHSLFTDKELGQEVRHWPKVPFRAGLLQCIPLAGPGPCTTGLSCQTADASGSGSQLSHWERSARPTYEGAPSLPVVGDDNSMKTQGALLLVRSPFLSTAALGVPQMARQSWKRQLGPLDKEAAVNPLGLGTVQP